MWSRARDAVNHVFDNTTFQDLIDEDLPAVANYCI
jgi:DNA-binding IscR family transcriptional regulator